jgi:tRNA (cytidine/uridine-2'-O-)-methyltransferase
MFHLILYQPEIPPNTGNIIRLCANTGAQLHLIGSLGFSLDDKQLRRAGLDYREFARIRQYETLELCLAELSKPRMFAFSTRGKRAYDEADYRPGDAFLFGSETRGLPAELLSRLRADQVLRVPMRPGNRSLNLSNAAAVVLYEAWRRECFAGGQ